MPMHNLDNILKILTFNTSVKVAKLHLKVSRQRQDKAIKDALALVQSNDLVVYEALRVRNLVKNRKLAKSISDASWYQFTEWFEFFAKIYRIVCVAVAHRISLLKIVQFVGREFRKH
jgi:transposase